MMNSMGAAMTEPEDQAESGKNVLWMTLALIGIVMSLGAIAGYMGASKSDDGLDGIGFVVLTGFGTIIAGLIYAVWRNARQIRSNGENMTRRERLNRNIIVACGLLGGAIGLVLAAIGILGSPDDAEFDPFAILGTGQIPVAAALAIVFVWAVVMPAVAWFWHTRVIDEQEASAYRDGGYYAAYAYLMLTPTWWLLWRGGMLPEPNGVAIYLIFSLIWSAVWFWKKYR
jgi:hypothetical protein